MRSHAILAVSHVRMTLLLGDQFQRLRQDKNGGKSSRGAFFRGRGEQVDSLRVFNDFLQIFWTLYDTVYKCVNLPCVPFEAATKLPIQMTRQVILGDPGAASRDEGIFVGESLLQQGDD